MRRKLSKSQLIEDLKVRRNAFYNGQNSIKLMARDLVDVCNAQVFIKIISERGRIFHYSYTRPLQVEKTESENVFNKWKGKIMKKAEEFAIRCNVGISVKLVSESGKIFTYRKTATLKEKRLWKPEDLKDLSSEQLLKLEENLMESLENVRYRKENYESSLLDGETNRKDDDETPSNVPLSSEANTTDLKGKTELCGEKSVTASSSDSAACTYHTSQSSGAVQSSDGMHEDAFEDVTGPPPPVEKETCGMRTSFETNPPAAAPSVWIPDAQQMEDDYYVQPKSRRLRSRQIHCHLSRFKNSKETPVVIED